MYRLSQDTTIGNTWRSPGTVEGVPHDKKSCFVKALEVDLEYAAAWRSLGLLGGGCLLWMWGEGGGGLGFIGFRVLGF